MCKHRLGPRVPDVTLFVDPDQLSALVILANYATSEKENVTIPSGAGCQSIGAFAYRELENNQPRVVVERTDISARNTVLPVLGNDVMSFTAPWPVFLRMEENVEGSFLQRETWHRLHQATAERTRALTLRRLGSQPNCGARGARQSEQRGRGRLQTVRGRGRRAKTEDGGRAQLISKITLDRIRPKCYFYSSAVFIAHRHAL